ncbi:SDR family NAD(P)-dependent oxidoreductase [Mucilaginibacter sp. 21P]|uniref:SDR family NAD(P)-dependent oxidoreductase n=1 Tax=Mucilaginibacter sp. 21P TaxID=2778902 RepID=UPI001C578ADE|nr:SDR family NAD(P)-dependent oxidoreductase [Mucilaginibacter sp. 21P]QXV63964.1 SDR family NAD(P)-dependent oxidoreductase [Mucilaginibacter sp. 21P]
MSKRIIIVGAGPNLSAAVTEKFTQNDFSVGLISRNEVYLKAQVAVFRQKGVQASYQVADAYNATELEHAVTRLAEQLGGVDVLLYNAAAMKFRAITDEKPEDLVADLSMSVANVLLCVKALQAPLTASKGTVLITGGGLATHPNVQVGSLSICKAALRNLAIQLYELLKKELIYVGTLTINNAIERDSQTHSPQILAGKFWEMYVNRSAAEVVY